MSRFEIGNFAAGMDLGVSESDTDMRWIPTEDIRDNPRNFYPHPTNEALSDLMESIKANGLLEPPSVVAAGDHYRLISGHSRMEAIRLLRGQDRERWDRVLCRVLPPTRSYAVFLPIRRASAASGTVSTSGRLSRELVFAWIIMKSS